MPPSGRSNFDMTVFLALLALLAQDSDVERIMLRFRQRAAQARSEQQLRIYVLSTRIELEKFLKEHPQDKDAPRAAWHIAESWMSEAAPEPALERLDAFLRQYPASEFVPSAKFARAQMLLQKEDDAGARAAFEDFAKLYPKDDRALYARIYAAVTYQNERKFAEAESGLKAVREGYRDRRESWGAAMQLAILYHLQERNAEARATLEEIVRQCPDREPVEVAGRHLSAYLKAGEEAPPFAERDLKLTEFSLQKHRGQVVVLYFFDPSTGGALEEARFLRRARDSFKPEDLQLFGVSVATDRRELGVFLEEAKIDWPIHYDAKGFEGKLAQLYGVRLLPSLTVIDRKGRIRFFNVAGRDLRTALSKVVEEK
jgi:TolA-binding protein/peroxiredoxin